jgi:hypothetical protein
MTAAQKTAKAKFKQAIAYRQKTGVSLKEAFAHIYGRKVGAIKKKTASKKKVARKVVRKKKVAKKTRVSGVRSTIKKAIRFTKGAKNQIKRGINKSIQNTKKYFNINTKNDLLLKRIKESVSDLVTYENTINNYMSYPIKERKKYMSDANINHVKKLIKETKTHIKELKKSL